jgi:hypothetical protein
MGTAQHALTAVGAVQVRAVRIMSRAAVTAASAGRS